MSVQSEINRISGNITAALAALAEKGVDVPAGSNSDALAGLIAAIEAGGGSYTIMEGSFTTDGSISKTWYSITPVPKVPAIAILWQSAVNITSKAISASIGTQERSITAYYGSSSHSSIASGRKMTSTGYDNLTAWTGDTLQIYPSVTTLNGTYKWLVLLE